MNLLGSLFGPSHGDCLRRLFDYPVFIWQVPCGSSSIDSRGGLVLSSNTARNIRANCQTLATTYANMILNFSPLMMDLEDNCPHGELMDFSKQPVEDFRLLMELCIIIKKWTQTPGKSGHVVVLVFLEESSRITYPSYAAMIATCYHIFAGCPSDGGSYTLGFVEEMLGVRRSRYHAASQEIYVNYFQLLLDVPILPSAHLRRTWLAAVSLHEMDSFKDMQLGLRIENEGNTFVFSDPTAWKANGDDGALQLSLHPKQCLFGDFSISLLRYELSSPVLLGQPEPPPKPRVLARWAFSTIFVSRDTHHVRARDMDYAAQSHLPSDAYMQLHFVGGEAEAEDTAYAEQLTRRIDQSPRRQMALLRPGPLSPPDRRRDVSSCRGDDDIVGGVYYRADGTSLHGSHGRGGGAERPFLHGVLPLRPMEEEERRYRDDDELALSLDQPPPARHRDPSQPPTNHQNRASTFSSLTPAKPSSSWRRKERRKRRRFYLSNKMGNENGET
ncbi:putative formin [Trypanosoma conorhini]|uniref:Putative formin n=1 Tax=Trypanosoma conorhini TaxID=83891 RepID=A0A3R7RDI4_9TRYP|nr:putative formin [Trypanosoma conorhini]RNF00416.1 putative formin [Trypanosoma conorhini]